MNDTSSLGPDFAGRFCYWAGASGRRYIHSIYPVEACPPLPGAIFLEVVAGAAHPRVVGAGRFPPFWTGPRAHASSGAEIHVHLLADGEAEAEAVLADLAAAHGLALRASLTRNRSRGESPGRAAIAA